MVFSVESRDSLESARRLREEVLSTIHQNAPSVRKWKRCAAARRPLVPLVVAANKCDLPSQRRAVDLSDARHLFEGPRSNTIAFIEGTSLCSSLSQFPTISLLTV